METEEQIEISFTRKWDPSQEGKAVPLNIDKRSLLSLTCMHELHIILFSDYDLKRFSKIDLLCLVGRQDSTLMPSTST